jgi:hypothetical protein
MHIEHWWNDTRKREFEVLGDTCQSQFRFAHNKILPGLNTDLPTFESILSVPVGSIFGPQPFPNRPVETSVPRDSNGHQLHVISIGKSKRINIIS